MALDAAQKSTAKSDDQPETGGVTASAVPDIAADRLRSLIERVERLEEERKALGSDIKDIYAEAKSAGFDVKVLRKLISLRKVEAKEREEMDGLLEVYMHALGM